MELTVEEEGCFDVRSLAYMVLSPSFFVLRDDALTQVDHGGSEGLREGEEFSDVVPIPLDCIVLKTDTGENRKRRFLPDPVGEILQGAAILSVRPGMPSRAGGLVRVVAIDTAVKFHYGQPPPSTAVSPSRGLAAAT